MGKSFFITCYCSLEVFLFSVAMVFTEASEYEGSAQLNKGVGRYLLASSCEVAEMRMWQSQQG